jgi:hypothetical protein
VILKHRRIVAAVLVIAVATACGGPGRHATTSGPPSTSTTGATHATNVPLYQQFERASAAGANGQAINATLAGKRYPSSTGMWVGCDGTPATATYRLDHNFSRLTGTAGLQVHTPDGLTARITITGDSRLLSDFTVSKTTTVPVDVNIVGAKSLVVSAILDQGTCAGSETPYGALGDALLIQVGV